MISQILFVIRAQLFRKWTEIHQNDIHSYTKHSIQFKIAMAITILWRFYACESIWLLHNTLYEHFIQKPTLYQVYTVAIHKLNPLWTYSLEFILLTFIIIASQISKLQKYLSKTNSQKKKDLMLLQKVILCFLAICQIIYLLIQ